VMHIAALDWCASVAHCAQPPVDVCTAEGFIKQRLNYARMNHSWHVESMHLAASGLSDESSVARCTQPPVGVSCLIQWQLHYIQARIDDNSLHLAGACQ
jgi:hypothetical protein